MKYPLAHDNWSSEEVKIVTRLLKNRNLTIGKNVEQFEKSFANFHSVKYAVMVNSGSSANHLMLSALKVLNKLSSKDEIIVPSLGWSTSYSPIYYHDQTLNLVDVDINTLNFDISTIEKSITKNTKAILAINALGNPNEFEKIIEICKKHKLILLEDNCESFGAEINNKYTGTFGMMSSFSFYYSHHLTTIEGGMILTNSKKIYEILLSLRSHGWTRHKISKGTSPFNKFKKGFEFILPGYNLRPMELSGALGVIQLKKAKKMLKIRRENADYFIKTFSKNKNFLIQKEIGNSSWFNFSLIIKNKKKFPINKLINTLYKKKVDCRRIIAGDFMSQKYSKYFKINKYSNYNSKLIHNYGFMVGNYDKDLKKQIEYLGRILN